MAKKKETNTTSDAQRQSRKEYLVNQKEAKQRRQIYLVVGAVVAVLALILVFALANELVLAPRQPVAIVNGEDITLGDWTDRVIFERAQRIILLENQLEAFNGDVGIIQQFASQPIIELQNAEELGQTSIDLMVREAIIRQQAEARGIAITDEDIDAALAESFNYFDGDSPTPFPTATETVMPTPSLTPLPTAVITELLPTNTPFPTPEPLPTGTPLPTATPVSLEAYNEQLGELVAEFEALGVADDIYRSQVAAQLYQEALMDALAVEAELSEEAEHASIFVLSFDTEAEANEALASVQNSDFLDVWNEVRSTPPDPDTLTSATATERLWLTQSDMTNAFGAQVANAAFSLDVGSSSEVLVQEDPMNELLRYYIVQVSGREVRPLSEAALNEEKQQLLANLIDEELAGNLEIREFWRSRVPTQPLLDDKFLQPPTPTPPSAAPPPIQDGTGIEIPEIPEVPNDGG